MVDARKPPHKTADSRGFSFLKRETHGEYDSISLQEKRIRSAPVFCSDIAEQALIDRFSDSRTQRGPTGYANGTPFCSNRFMRRKAF